MLTYAFRYLVFCAHLVIFPTLSDFRIKLPWILSLCVTGAVLGIQSLNYVPSYIKTTLKFRTGIHQSLGDAFFEDYRPKAAFDENLLGAMFFSVVASGLIITGVLVSIIAVLVAPIYRDIVISLLILVAGVAIFIVILVCLLIPFKLKCFAKFYRVHPARTHVGMLPNHIYSFFYFSSGGSAYFHGCLLHR
jgi:hypothetical protein